MHVLAVLSPGSICCSVVFCTRQVSGKFLAARLRTLPGIIPSSLCTVVLQVMRVEAMPLAAGSATAAPVTENPAGQPLFGAAAAASWGGLRIAREVSNALYTLLY